MNSKKIVKYGCNCNISFDVRCCCWVNDKSYDTCHQKIPTVYWRITNDYELYQKIEESGFNSIKKYIRKTCRLSESEWEKIKYFYDCDNQDIED